MWLFKKTRPATTNLYSVAVLKSTNSNKSQCLVYQSKTWILLKIIFLGTYFTLTLFQLFTLKLKLISRLLFLMSGTKMSAFTLASSGPLLY